MGLGTDYEMTDGWTGRTIPGVVGRPFLRDPMIDECCGYTVYGHLTPRMKWYFGITKKPPERRWGKNGSGYKSSPRFYAAIEKYGWNNIWHHIVGTGYTKDEACGLEIALIRQYNTLGDGGYNCTAGGDGLHEHQFTPEQIKKMRKSHLGQQSAAAKWVWCIETGQMFESATAGARAIGLGASAVSRAARGDKATAGGYHWAYIGDVPKEPNKGSHHIQVACIETGKIYESCVAAAKKMGVSSTAIRYATRDTNRTCCGYHWTIDGCLVDGHHGAPRRHARRKPKEHPKAEGQMVLF